MTMPTLSSVPEEEQRSGELRKQIQDMMTSMPEGVVSTRDIKLQYSTTDYIWVVNGLESLINQQIKSVLDELEGEAIEIDGDVGMPLRATPLSTIQKIRSRYE